MKRGRASRLCVPRPSTIPAGRQEPGNEKKILDRIYMINMMNKEKVKMDSRLRGNDRYKQILTCTTRVSCGLPGFIVLVVIASAAWQSPCISL